MSSPSFTETRPKLIFFGDPRGDFEPIVRTILRLRPEAIVLLGDIQARQPLQLELAAVLELTEVCFIHGNHDTDTELHYDNLWGSSLAGRNLHGRVVNVGGYRIAGLGGIFREMIWDPKYPDTEPAVESAEVLRRTTKASDRWRGGIPLRHHSTIFKGEFTRLSRERADVLVTHEGLGGLPHGNAAVDALALSMGVGLVVHGHLHMDINYMRDGRLNPDSPFLAYGVDQGSYLCWSPGSDGMSRPVRATDVYGGGT